MKLASLYIIIAFFASCEVYHPFIADVEYEKEEIVMSQEKVTEEKDVEVVVGPILTPMDEFPHYYKEDSGRIYGIKGETVSPLSYLTDGEVNYKTKQFCARDGKIFLSIERYEKGELIEGSDPEQFNYEVVERFYKQNNGEISEITEKVFNDEKPERYVETVKLESYPFKISDSMWDNRAITNVMNGPLPKNFLPIYSAVITDGYLYLEHPDSINNYLCAGLWQWEANSGRCPRIKEKGQLW